MGEAARVADVADDGEDFVLDEGFGFGGTAGETVDGVVARAEEGFGKREAKVASGTKDEDGRHSDGSVLIEDNERCVYDEFLWGRYVKLCGYVVVDCKLSTGGE